MITDKSILVLAGLLAMYAQAYAQVTQINPYTGVPEAESAAKRELALLKLQTQIQQQKVEMKKEDFKLKNLDKILRAELNKQLRDLSGESSMLPARLPDPPMPARTRAGTNAPVNLPAPVQAKDTSSQPVETKLSAVIKRGSELVAVITRGAESVTAKEGDLAFGETVTEITQDSVLLGGRRLTIGALLHANVDVHPKGVSRVAEAETGQGNTRGSATLPAFSGIPPLSGGNFQ